MVAQDGLLRRAFAWLVAVCCERGCVLLCRTKRTWLPNVQLKRIYSDALGMPVRIHVTTYALRCIDKAGGLDAYLLKARPAAAVLALIVDIFLFESMLLEVATSHRCCRAQIQTCCCIRGQQESHYHRLLTPCHPLRFAARIPYMLTIVVCVSDEA